jgi:cardiolipin synthase
MPTTDSIETPGQFHWLPTVNEAFDSMLGEIYRATESIRLEMYIYTQSGIGECFRDALARAAVRGVRVWVLVDALGSLTLPTSFWDPLVRAGGRFRWFNPLRVKRFSIRNHRKLLICDGRTAFVGGFNIGREYEGDGVARGWYDLGLRLTGPMVGKLTTSFDALFAVGDFLPRGLVRGPRAMLPGVVSTGDGQLIMSAPGTERGQLRRTLMRDLRGVQNVRIISAYFLPTRAIRRDLFKVVRHGGTVRLILPGKSDVPLAQLASRHFYQMFLRAGVEIYEYEPQILHAKLFVFDDVVYAGSANLDRRSLFINYELLLRLPSGDLAAEAVAIFEAALKHCRRIDPAVWRRSRGFWGKLKERLAFIVLSRLDPYVASRQTRHLDGG